MSHSVVGGLTGALCLSKITRHSFPRAQYWKWSVLRLVGSGNETKAAVVQNDCIWWHLLDCHSPFPFRFPNLQFINHSIHHLLWILCSHHGNNHLLEMMFTNDQDTSWLIVPRVKVLGSRLITVHRHNRGWHYSQDGSCEQSIDQSSTCKQLECHGVNILYCMLSKISNFLPPLHPNGLNSL